MLVPQLEETVVGPGLAHRPVMVQEVVRFLSPGPGAVLVDANLGGGGHARALLQEVGPAGRVFGIDLDPGAVDSARERLAEFGGSFLALHVDHCALVPTLNGLGIETVDGVLFDLGLSSLQLDDPERGFSFRQDGPLDMRMDPTAGRPAADWLAEVGETELREVLHRYGEERRARAIARAIVRERSRRPIRRTRQLADLVERVLGPRGRVYRIHPATRTFQALRIVVNREIDRLGPAIEEAVSLLRSSGRIVVIAYHSLEDREVKHTFRSLAERCTCPPDLPVCGCGATNVLRVLTPRPVRPTPAETDANPRSRSAKLRAAEKL